MPEGLESVDTSTIEELQELTRQVDVLRERLDAMEERKDSVSEAVYERVAADYQSQLDALAEESAPLKAKARDEYGKLQEIWQGLEKAQADAKLAKEEVEFRHELGEFEDGEFEKILEEHQEALETRESELAEAGVVRQRFIDAFGSEEDLEEAETTEEVEVAEEATFEPVSDLSDEIDAAGTMAVPTGGGVPPLPDDDDEGANGSVPSAAESDDEADEDDEDDEDDGAEVSDDSGPVPVGTDDDSDDDEEDDDDDWSTASTNVFASPMVPPEPGPAPPPFDPASGAAPSDVPTDATRILPKPRLVSLEGGEPTSTFVLGPAVVTLGRATDNSIRLTEEAVSRHHAEVIPGPDGFLLRDQGSENGTYVNGKRKKEHLLTEGDIIQIGVRKLRFHDA